MAKKQIKWGNKELPGLSFEELNDLTVGKINQSLNAEQQRSKIDDVAKKKAAEGGKKSTKRYDSEYQSECGKIGGPLGGEASKAKIISELGEEGAKEYWKQMGSNIYENMEDKKAWHMAGNKKSIDNRRKALDLILDSMIAEIPNEPFCVTDVSHIMVKHGKGPKYFVDVLRLRPDSFEMVGKITQSKGAATKLYKKITIENK